MKPVVGGIEMTEITELVKDFKKEIREKAIDEFAHKLKKTFTLEFPSNYESTKPYFTLENARMIVDEIAEQLKGGDK